MIPVVTPEHMRVIDAASASVVVLHTDAGLTGCGDVLLEELFTFPAGLDPAVEEAIEEFMAQKKRKAQMVKDLEAKAALGGVKGLTAKAELNQLAAADSTDPSAGGCGDFPWSSLSAAGAR